MVSRLGGDRADALRRDLGPTAWCALECLVERADGEAIAQVDAAWAAYISAKRTEELERIITEEGLDPEATRSFIDAAFRDGAVQPSGTAITKILPPVSRFGESGGHAAKKQTVLGKLGEFFDRFFGLS